MAHILVAEDERDIRELINFTLMFAGHTVTLAANAVLMNFLMLSSFYLDGLANAAEQITGRAVGARYRPAFDRGLKLTTIWSFGLAGIISLFFLVAGERLIAALTTSPDVREAANLYLPWAAITGLTGALAFLMDGVFIGATWSNDMRNRMLMSFIVYLAALAIFVPFFANHGLWLAINLGLLSRGVFLALRVGERADPTFRPAQSSLLLSRSSRMEVTFSRSISFDRPRTMSPARPGPS